MKRQPVSALIFFHLFQKTDALPEGKVQCNKIETNIMPSAFQLSLCGSTIASWLMYLSSPYQWEYQKGHVSLN